MEFSSEKVKWKNIAFMTEAVPVDSEKGIQLRKQISFLALNSICIRNIEPEIEDRFGFNVGFRSFFFIYRWIIIENVSMLHTTVLQFIFKARIDKMLQISIKYINKNIFLKNKKIQLRKDRHLKILNPDFRNGNHLNCLVKSRNLH